MIAGLRFAVLCGLALVSVCAAQTRAPYKATRAADGHADLQGIWQAISTAQFDVEEHNSSAGVPPGRSVIVDPPDGRIPYRPEAISQRDRNREQGKDPYASCFLPGVPRFVYVPFPFQIFQTSRIVVMTSEYNHTTRSIQMNRKTHLDEVEFWMGDSLGHWEGDTLVVDVSNLDAGTWIDASGNFHSEQLHVVERFTRTSPNTMLYEATLEDPKVYTRPWTLRIPLYLHEEKNFQLYEYECQVYQESASAPAR